MKDERIIAGMSCSEVLADLSDYVDGDLDADRRRAVEAHVRACDLCARFGGVFAATVQALRGRLGAEPEELPGDVARRLGESLRRARGR